MYPGWKVCVCVEIEARYTLKPKPRFGGTSRGGKCRMLACMDPEGTATTRIIISTIRIVVILYIPTPPSHKVWGFARVQL